MKVTRWKVSLKKPRAKDGANWLIRVRPPARSGAKEQVRSSGTTDRAAAEDQARELQAKLNADLEGFDAAHANRDLTFEEVFRAHQAFREVDAETAPLTRDKYRSLARTLADNVIWKMSASRVDRVAVVRARDQLVAKKLDATTVNLHVSRMKRAWNWAHERGLVPHAFPSLKRLKTKPTEMRPFTDEEVALVLEKLRTHRDGWWYPIFCLQADTGSRIGGVLKLRGRDVDYEGCKVTYRNKTKPYSVPVPPETVARLPRVTGDQFLFPGKRSGKVMSSTYAGQVFREVMEASGIEDQELLASHSFRRRAVATTLRSNVPMPVSMKFTGHASMKVHMDYQRNAVGDDLREVSRVLLERRKNPSHDPSRDGWGAPPQPLAAPGASPSVTTPG